MTKTILFRNGSSRPTSSSRPAQRRAFEVELLHPRSFTARWKNDGGKTILSFWDVNFQTSRGVRVGCLDCWLKLSFWCFWKRFYISNFDMKSWALSWLLIWCMSFCKKYSPGWRFFCFFRATLDERFRIEPTIQVKWWWITHVVFEAGILRFDLDWMISNLTSSININILNICVGNQMDSNPYKLRFHFQKTSETERINPCKKHPSLLVIYYCTIFYHSIYIQLCIYNCKHRTSRERERERVCSLLAY